MQGAKPKKRRRNYMAKPAARGKIRMYLLTSVFSVLCLLLVSLFWREPLLLFSLLLANAAFMLSVGTSRRRDTAIFALCGIWGALSEAVAISFGAWSYPMPDFLGIPFWLPLVWGTAAVFLIRLSEAVGELVKQ